VSYVVHDDVFAAGELEERATITPRVATLLGTDKAHDLALLRALAPPRHASALPSAGPIARGVYAQAMGHSIGLYWSYSSGDVAAVRRKDIGVGDGSSFTWIQTTAPISPGNSGGGLFDADGDLMGICSASFTRGQNLNIFVHRMHIVAFLNAEAGR
jgi:serine protease Do